VSSGHAGQLLVTAGQNIDRLRGDCAFAALCGASPILASSGRTNCHRLNYGGDAFPACPEHVSLAYLRLSRKPGGVVRGV
jgi:transposase